MRRRTFRDARCLVTGASSGLGRAIVEHLAREGARVVLTGRSRERLDEVTAGLIATGVSIANLAICPADLTIAAERSALLEFVSDRFDGALDVVVNSAGIGAYGRFESHDETILRQVFEVNVIALAEICRGVLPMLRRGDRPSLVNVGSIIAQRACRVVRSTRQASMPSRP